MFFVVAIALLITGGVRAETSAFLEGDCESHYIVSLEKVSEQASRYSDDTLNGPPVKGETGCERTRDCSGSLYCACVPQSECCYCSGPRPHSVKFMGELLYWRVVEDGFCSSCGSSSKNYQWNPGYRLGLGFQPVCSPCQGALIWTNFQFNTRSGCNDQCGWFWKFRYQTLDAILIGSYCWNSCVNVNPYWGFRGALVRQSVFSNVENESKCTMDNFCVIKERDNKVNFKGLGPLIGVAPDYRINRCLSLYGSVAIGLIYGNHHSRSFGSDTFTDSDQTCVCLENKSNQASQLFIDGVVGVRWKQTICRKFHVTYQFGLEHHRYFGFNHIGCSGDLCFDGCNFSAGVCF